MYGRPCSQEGIGHRYAVEMLQTGYVYSIYMHSPSKDVEMHLNVCVNLLDKSLLCLLLWHAWINFADLSTP